MKILFATGNPYMPEAFGGMQTSADELCRALMRRGHQVSILSRFRRKGLFGLFMAAQKLALARKVSRDTQYGYPVWRSWYPWEQMGYILQKERFDLVVVMAVEPVRMAEAAEAANVPVVMLLQDVAFDQHGGDIAGIARYPCITNSAFTAKSYLNAYGIRSTVILPFVSRELYKTDPVRKNVTFINPIEEKGLEISLEVARCCPDIPFSFVESWPLSDEYRNRLRERIGKLPNVSLTPPQRDMRSIYKQCKILLAPSVCQEGFGRVVSEAQISGIPVIASRRGGLPEAVGDGGILVDPEGEAQEWVDAIRMLWDDHREYDRYASLAVSYSKRPEMRFENQVDAYESVFKSALISGR